MIHVDATANLEVNIEVNGGHGLHTATDVGELVERLLVEHFNRRYSLNNNCAVRVRTVSGYVARRDVTRVQS